MNKTLKLFIIIIAGISSISMFILPIIAFVSLTCKQLCYILWFVFTVIFVICNIILNRYDTE